ncbi:hypothetical protein JW766_06695 [Candidatus Dojkabacteria bacterium]|nr:hypothetical protein [Candidatus Dojkabacteria bacterium]
MEFGDLPKLILAVAVSLSCVGISYQIMRLLGAITENMQDLRKTIKNLGILVEGLVEDQKLLSEGLRGVLEIIEKVRAMSNMVYEKVMKPITVIFGFLTTVGNFVEGVKGKYFKNR